jgi:hypothetical protein
MGSTAEFFSIINRPGILGKQPESLVKNKMALEGTAIISATL